MRRRQVLIAAGAATAGGVTVLAFPWVSAYWKRASILRRLGPEVGALIEVAPDAGTTGHRLGGLGNDPAQLGERLRTGLALQPGDVPNAERARRLLAAAIRDDFSNDRVILHDGWVLSQTEAALARLRWLVAGEDARRDPQPAPDAPVVIVEVEDWGPQSTFVGVPFGTRRSGHHRLRFSANNAPPWIVLRIDGRDMPTWVSPTRVVARIPDRRGALIAEPGTHRVELFDPPTGRLQHVGEFEVLPRPEPFVHADGSVSPIFCGLSGWGPREATAGTVPNPLPDGTMGLWIKTPCVPPDSAVFLGEIRLKTAIRPDRVTARIPPELLQQPGALPISILHFGTKERLPVGQLQISPAQ